MENAKQIKLIPGIVDRFAEDAAFFWLQREEALNDSTYDRQDLAELDERIAAHLDGLLVAGFAAWEVIDEIFFANEPGESFVKAWFALSLRDGSRFDAVLKQALADEEYGERNFKAIVSAFGWLSRNVALGYVESFLNANNAVYQRLGISASAILRFDCGASLQRGFTADDPRVVARALRAAGELGRRDLLADIKRFSSHDDAAVKFWASWSLQLLDGSPGMQGFKQTIIEAGELALPAIDIACRSVSMEESKRLVQTLATAEETKRLAIKGAGAAGHAYWVPGLIRFMAEPELARLAGDALSLISGLQIANSEFEVEPPEDFDTGPNEDPADENVALDPDEGLPWPGHEKLARWWQLNQQKFTPDVRYLAGQPIEKARCENIFMHGTQTERAAAALEMALMGERFLEYRAITLNL